jgi:hypothetical protein
MDDGMDEHTYDTYTRAALALYTHRRRKRGPYTRAVWARGERVARSTACTSTSLA